MIIIWSCPDCGEDLTERDGGNMWCRRCERTVPDPQLATGDPDE